MAFKDYNIDPDLNETIGDGIYIGPNMARDDVRPALQQLASDGRGVYDYLLDLDLGGTPPTGFARSASVAALQAETGMVAGMVRYLAQAGRVGFFEFLTAADVLSRYGIAATAAVTADPLQGLYISPASDTTGAGGVWARVHRDVINPFWFMSTAEVADVLTSALTQNVTLAIQAAAAALQAQGGGTLFLPPGKYLVGKQTFNGTTLDGSTTVRYGASPVITILNCPRPVKISGYGAVLKCAAGLKYGSFDAAGNRYNPTMPFYDYAYYGYIYRGMIDVEGNAGVTIEGLELDGNNTALVLGGYFGDSQWQIEGHGIFCQNNGSALIQDCYIHHQPTDGIVLRGNSGETDATLPKPMKVQNVRCRYNGRQAISLTGGKNIHIDNCDLSQTGQAMNTVSAELMQSAPGCGLDIEAESGGIRDVLVSNTTIIGNWSRGVGANTGDSRRVKFSKCKIEYAQVARPEYVLEDCTLVGYTNLVLALNDQYKATTPSASLTIASSGGGVYTITRASGSFITDGFAVTNIVQLFGGFVAGNKQKNLTITALTATVMTVTVNDGSALTAEGPIAAAMVGTAYTAKDTSVCRRCNFLYDATLTESGTLVNPAQSDFGEAVWWRFEDCFWYTGSVNLPSFGFTYTAVSEGSTLLKNCRFLTTSSALVIIAARWQGRNYINHAGTVSLLLGTQGRLEAGGDIIVNGVGQTPAWTAATGTATRSTFATGSVTLPQLAEHVKALIDDLFTHGLIGT